MACINEWDWDESGTDVNEFIEIFISDPQPADLSQYCIEEYENATTLNTTSGGNSCLNGPGWTTTTVAGGVLYTLFESFENGDAVALCGPLGLIQFFGTDESFTASTGCANGAATTDVALCSADYLAGGSLQKVPGTNDYYICLLYTSPSARDS